MEISFQGRGLSKDTIIRSFPKLYHPLTSLERKQVLYKFCFEKSCPHMDKDTDMEKI